MTRIKAKWISIGLLLFSATLIYYLPILNNPSILLNRSNDLEEQFWPFFDFIKDQIINHHQLPLWINSFFSGMPLISDPQFSLFYPLNWGFIIFPLGFWFITYCLIHTFIGGLGIYLLGKIYFKFSSIASLVMALIYIFSPKQAAYLEAGHIGLVAATNWVPWVVLFLLLLFRRKALIFSICLAVSLSAIFFTHTVIFALSITFLLVVLLIRLLTKQESLKEKFNQVKFVFAALTICFGLSAVTLLPQIDWIPQTSRILLITNPDTYPKWNSLKEFAVTVIIPWMIHPTELQKMDSEKWLIVGIFPLSLSIIGFFLLTKRRKILLLIVFLISGIVILNNLSPLYNFLLSQKWFLLMRVATRIWFVIVLILTILSGLAINQLIQTKPWSKLLLFLIPLVLLESIALSWIKLFTPIQVVNFAPQAIYDFLKQDPSHYRVFCLTRCLSQKKAVNQHIEQIEGYNTLQQFSYFQQMWQFTNLYWNYYTLSLPPIGIIKNQIIKPDVKALSLYNTKYLIAPYSLSDPNLKLRKKIDQYFVYENTSVFPRAYFYESTETNKEAPILRFSPNEIRVDVSLHLSDKLILAEVYSKDWNGYLNGNDKTSILERPNSTRLVNIKKDTRFVDFKYEPNSFRVGKIVTLFTIFFLLVVLWKRRITVNF